jgi:hypothetical protein
MAAEVALASGGSSEPIVCWFRTYLGVSLVGLEE